MVVVVSVGLWRKGIKDWIVGLNGSGRVPVRREQYFELHHRL